MKYSNYSSPTHKTVRFEYNKFVPFMQTKLYLFWCFVHFWKMFFLPSLSPLPFPPTCSLPCPTVCTSTFPPIHPLAPFLSLPFFLPSSHISKSESTLYCAPSNHYSPFIILSLPFTVHIFFRQLTTVQDPYYAAVFDRLGLWLTQILHHLTNPSDHISPAIANQTWWRSQDGEKHAPMSQATLFCKWYIRLSSSRNFLLLFISDLSIVSGHVHMVFHPPRRADLLTRNVLMF